MARKNIVPSFKMLDAASLGGNLTSAVVNVQNMDLASIHLKWTGTAPVGVITVEARNGSADPYYTLDFGSAINISGASGDHQIVLSSMPFTDIRLQYFFTSGSGSLTATITAKQIGG